MAQQYISYMVAKAQNMQNNKLSLIQELGHLQLAQAKHEKQSKLHEEKPYILEYKVREEASNKFEAMKKLELEHSKVMGYQMQILELNQKIERMQRENHIKIDRIKWEAKAKLNAKDIQLEATKRA